MKSLTALIVIFLGVAVVMGVVVGSALMLPRPMGQIGPVAVAPAPAPAMQAGYPSDTAKPIQVQVVADEWRMDPNRLEVAAGAPFKLVLRNQGTLEIGRAHV